jgi:hypothetical protein
MKIVTQECSSKEKNNPPYNPSLASSNYNQFSKLESDMRVHTLCCGVAKKVQCFYNIIKYGKWVSTNLQAVSIIRPNILRKEVAKDVRYGNYHIIRFLDDCLIALLRFLLIVFF